MKKSILLVIAIIVCAVIMSKNDHKYADIDCPVCGSCDVLDISDEDTDDQQCICVECGTEFSINK